jgi:hypothetical protein
MDLSSQRQYIQRAVNAKLDVSGTASLETIYTAPTGGDFDFAIIESLLVGDDGNQQTNVDIVITSGAANHYLWKNHNIAAYETQEMLSKSLILTAGEILKIQVNHANINVTASIVEYGKGD